MIEFLIIWGISVPITFFWTIWINKQTSKRIAGAVEVPKNEYLQVFGLCCIPGINVIIPAAFTFMYYRKFGTLK